MPTSKLIATKAYSYATRRLQAGDEFEAANMHARILVGARKARYADVPIEKVSKKIDKPIHQPQPDPSAAADTEEKAEATVEAEVDMPLLEPKNIDSLRAQAARLGITVDGRWGVARLQYEITRASK